MDHRDQPVRGRAGHRDVRARSSSDRAPGTWSTSPPWPGSCTRPAWRRTTRSRPPWSRSPRRPATSSRLGRAASVVCPSYFRTDLISSMRGRDEALGGVIAQLVAGAPLGRTRSRPPCSPASTAGGADPARRGRPGGVRPQGRRPACVRRAAASQAARLHARCRDRRARRGPRGGRLRRRGRRLLAPRERRTGVRRRGRRRAGGPAVPRRGVEPDLPASLPGRRADPAPASGRCEGARRPRHGARVPDPVRAAPAFPLVPAMVAFCDDDAVLGSDFYVDGAGRGHHRAARAALAAAAEQVSALCGRTWDVLAELHAVDVTALPDLGRAGPRKRLRRPAGRRLDRPAVRGRRPTTSGTGRRSPTGCTSGSLPTSGSA